MRDIVTGHVEKRYIQPGLVIAIAEIKRLHTRSLACRRTGDGKRERDHRRAPLIHFTKQFR